MIFEQLFDEKSSTYTYIISSGKGREGLIIDPVIENTDIYLKFMNSMDLKLVKVIDTHIHADHITGLNELHKRTNCLKIMGENSKSEVIDLRVKENDKINIENLELKTIYTPGHTDCSYSFLLNDKIFTGDTLFSLGCGRIFEGTYEQMFNSLNKIKELPKDTEIYCGHEYTLQNGNFCLANDTTNKKLREKISKVKKTK